MGSGKSSIGNLVSKKLDLQFVDVDSLIIENTGMSISEIFEKKGENYFRNLEEKITLKYLKKILFEKKTTIPHQMTTHSTDVLLLLQSRAAVLKNCHD